MRLRVSSLSAILCVIMAASCGTSSPTSPTPATTPTPTGSTRVITVTGDLAFGYVDLGMTAERTFRINNTGNQTLTFTSMSSVGGTGSAGYDVNPTSGTIAPGAVQIVTVQFSPTLVQVYANVLTVASDQTSGGSEINVSGTGVRDLPLYIR
jgi:hypothetical protein